MDLKKYYGITKSQYKFLDEYLRSKDKLMALRAGEYSTAAENIDKNFDDIMGRDKVKWAYQKMVREKAAMQKDMDDNLKMTNAGTDGSEDFKKIIVLLEEALLMAKSRKNATAMGGIVKTLAEIKGLYQPKKQAQKILQIEIHERFDESEQGGAIDYEG